MMLLQRHAPWHDEEPLETTLPNGTTCSAEKGFSIGSASRSPASGEKSMPFQFKRLDFHVADKQQTLLVLKSRKKVKVAE